MMQFRPTLSALLPVLAVSALVAAPLAAAATDVVAGRLSAYREMGAAFKNVNDELRSGNPNAYVIQVSAREIRKVAKDQYSYFPAGTGPGTGKTKALAAIWSKPSAFKAAQDAFAKEAEQFYVASRSGDMAKIKAATRDLGQTCKTCHATFRAD